MNKLVLGVLLGIVISAIAAALGAYLVITSGIIPARQDERPSDFERWAAHQSLRATLNREAQYQCPIQADEQNLMAGAKIYANNCSGCHGAPGSPSPSFGSGFSPNAPLFANGASVTDDPEGKIYWKVDHGVRFTGMPSFNRMLKENEMWQVTVFLKHLDKLPPAVDEYWKKTK